MEMTGGQALAGQLVAEGVRDVFGIPGVQLDWATDALAGVADRIRYVIPRHEQAASYMADGYARASGRERVCMVVPGPGLLNAMTGLATAYACNSRVLCIAGQIPSPTIGAGLGMLHEVRGQSEILGAVTKWHALARRPEDVAPLVHEAFVQLRSGRPQPVGLEIPPDVLAARADVRLLAAAPQAAPDAGDAALLDEAACALRGARFPVVYAGGGALFAGAALRRFAETLQTPVVMSPNGRGALAHDHPLAASALAGRCLLPHADLVVVVGSRFIDGSGQPVHAHPGCRFVYVNLEARDAGPPRRPGIALQADAGAALSALLARLEGFRASESRAEAVAKVRTWCDVQLDALQPQREYLDVLRRCLPADGVFVNELTQVGYVANLAFPVPGPHTFISPGY